MLIKNILDDIKKEHINFEKEFILHQLLEESGMINASKSFIASRFINFGDSEICNFLRNNQLSIMRTVKGLDKFKDKDLLRKTVALCFIDSDTKIRLCTGYSINVDITWRETLLEEYNNVPPENVLRELIDSKKILEFDYYTVAKLDVTFSQGMTDDPLLIGRIRKSNRRYVIAQWDNDICLEKILESDN